MNHRAIQALGTFTERQARNRRLAEERPKEPWNDRGSHRRPGTGGEHVGLTGVLYAGAIVILALVSIEAADGTSRRGSWSLPKRSAAEPPRLPPSNPHARGQTHTQV